MNKRIAVVGSGIAGMTVAYYLRDHYDITLFEKNPTPGGHTNTVDVRDQTGRSIPVDTGFMVYNDITYPNLNRLFDELGVDPYPTDMSFGVHDSRTKACYSASGFNGFFAQRSRLLSVSHWNMIRGILTFFKDANAFLAMGETAPDNLTIREFFNLHRTPQNVASQFVYPMASAIWSTHNTLIEEYPAKSLFRFMANHGLLGVGQQFQWKTLRGGSRQYRDRMLATLVRPPIVNAGITGVRRNGNQSVSLLHDDGIEQHFDIVVIATHADEALALLHNPTELESSLLSQFTYTRNTAVLHSDTSVLPPLRRAWASWNYRIDGTNDNGHPNASTHYWMNQLQPLCTHDPFIVSIDYQGNIDPGKIHWSQTYHHPSFTSDAMQAQRDLPALNRNSRILYCGSYFRYGFHEDAHVSGLRVVNELKERMGNHHEVLPLSL